TKRTRAHLRRAVRILLAPGHHADEPEAAPTERDGPNDPERTCGAPAASRARRATMPSRPEPAHSPHIGPGARRPRPERPAPDGRHPRSAVAPRPPPAPAARPTPHQPAPREHRRRGPAG